MMLAVMELLSKRPRILPDLQYGPTLGGCELGKRGVGIDGNRMGDPRKQRNVVTRVAVEPALPKVAESKIATGEPCVESRDFALAHVRQSRHFAREAPVTHFRLGRDHVLETEFTPDRTRQKPARGRCHHAKIALANMARDQLPGNGWNCRNDFRAQPCFTPSLETIHRMPGQRRKIEF